MHSQNREEEIILMAMGHKAKGYVLDIGANDGITLSNSRALIERGWHGCMVEPDYEAFAKLAALYKDNPDITLINAAVDLEGGPAQLKKSDAGGLVTTLHDTAWDAHMIHKYWVSKMLPSTVAELCTRGADVVTVDIEGRSFEIAAKLPEAWGVKVFCIEHDHRAEEIAAWGNSRNMRVVDLNAENIILVKRS